MNRCGTDARDNNSVGEWLANNDVISRQVKLLDKKEDVGGFCPLKRTNVLKIIDSELWKWYTRYQPVYHFYFVFL